MKYTVMKCPICGKDFYEEYWRGGYIDHVTNFAEQLLDYRYETIERPQEFIDRLVEDIYYDGNDIREKDDIECRLNCFLKAEFIPKEIREEVEKAIRPHIGKKENVVNRLIHGINELIKDFTDDEMSYLYRAVEEKLYGTYSPLLAEIETVVEDELRKRGKRQ